MKLNYSTNWLPSVGRWLTGALVSLVAIALIWQSPLGLNVAAMAAPSPTLVASADRVKGAADDVRDSSKNLIQDTKRKVEKTANRNAAKVDQADDSGSFVERKAKRDKARIEKRAEEDAARTSNAVDKSMNAVKGVVDNVKDAFTD